MKEYSYRLNWNNKRLVRTGKKVQLCNGATTRKFTIMIYENGRIYKKNGWSVYDCLGRKQGVFYTHKDAKLYAESLIDFTKSEACIMYYERYEEESI